MEKFLQKNETYFFRKMKSDEIWWNIMISSDFIFLFFFSWMHSWKFWEDHPNNPKVNNLISIYVFVWLQTHWFWDWLQTFHTMTISQTYRHKQICKQIKQTTNQPTNQPTKQTNKQTNKQNNKYILHTQNNNSEKNNNKFFQLTISFGNTSLHSLLQGPWHQSKEEHNLWRKAQHLWEKVVPKARLCQKPKLKLQVPKWKNIPWRGQNFAKRIWQNCLRWAYKKR